MDRSLGRGLCMSILACALIATTLPEAAETDLSIITPPAVLPLEVPRPIEPRGRAFLSSYRLPDTMTFAGDPVPIQMWQVRERIEYEFYRFLEDEGDSIILAKRTGRCFPTAERQLAEAGMPDDLKYILLVESKCISAAYSRAKESTCDRHGRACCESPDSAARALVALAAGARRWRQVDLPAYAGQAELSRGFWMSFHELTNYWKLHYVTETMRYVPRVMAVKEIFSQPEKYLGLAKSDLYTPLDTEIVTVNVKDKQRHLASVAEEYGTYFLELKLLNPEIRKDYLPRGTHRLKIPRRKDDGCPVGCYKADIPR